ncbi:hypothetical protein [Nonomuraea rubra]|uniref:hypothetical protein n=1 Tax=Nonomuraea rubra TaxID=46180 RepID=UPI0033F3F3FB
MWRRRLRLSYEVWQVLHTVMATLAVTAALVHVLLVNHYVDSLWKQVLWAIMSAAFVGLLLWIRIVRPLRLWRRPWVVEQVIPESGEITVLVLRPRGHGGLRSVTSPPASAPYHRAPPSTSTARTGCSPSTSTRAPGSA